MHGIIKYTKLDWQPTNKSDADQDRIRDSTSLLQNALLVGTVVLLSCTVAFRGF